MRRLLLVSAAVLGGCGSAGSPSLESGGSPSATTTPAVSVVDTSDAASGDVAGDRVSELPDGLLGLEPLRSDFDELSLGDFEDGGCSFAAPGDLISAPLVFRGDVVSVSELGEYPSLDEFGTVVGRMVEFEVTDVIVDVDGVAVDADRLWAVTSEERIDNATRYVAIDRLAEVEPGDNDVLAAAYNALTPSAGRVPQLAHAIVDDDGTSRLDGNCSHLAEEIDWVAQRLGDASGYEMLVRMATLRAAGEPLDDLDDATNAWQTRNDPPPWEQQDPQRRSMVPSAVPAEMRPSLDVVGVWVALDDPEASVFVRTDSGLSEPGLSAGVLPGATPLYFFDTDTTIEVLTSSGGSVESFTVIADIAVSQVIGQGGIEVTGSVQRQDVTVTVLSRREMAERLSVDEALLDTLRETYLSL